MRMLYITAEVPYPLTSGYLRHYHFLRVLSARHEITHLSLTRRPELSSEAVAALDPYVEQRLVFGLPRGPEGPRFSSRAGQRVQNAVRQRRAVAAMRRAVRELLAREHFDVIVTTGKPTVAAIDGLAGVPLVVDCCDARSLRIRGEMRYASASRRLALLPRLAAALRVERKSVGKTSHLAFASVRDQQAMTGSTERGEIVPQAVDLDYWRARSPLRRPSRVLFHGAMRYPPNDDAAVQLAEEIGPLVRERVPDLEVFVVGRDPTPRLRAAVEKRPWVTVTGELEDVRPHFDSATVYCAPLRFASGIQNKLLEALAMEVPVVTTRIAADGLSVDGAELPLVVADGAYQIAEEIVRLLGREEERAQLAAAGRRFVSESFSWERSAGRLERLCEEAVAEWSGERGPAEARPCSAAEDPARQG